VKISNTFFSFFRHNQSSLIFHMWQVKKTEYLYSMSKHSLKYDIYFLSESGEPKIIRSTYHKKNRHQLVLGSFHVKQAKIKQKCHPGSRISKLIFFVDSASNSKKKSHITFFSKTSPSRPFWTLRLFFGQKRVKSMGIFQKYL
jgi:hypothetical protein